VKNSPLLFLDMEKIMELRDQLQQLEQNEKLSFQLGKKTYKIARLGQWTSMRINRLIFELQKKRSEEDIRESDDDRLLVPKVISLAILKYPWRIRLFHWYLWRKLNRKYSQQDFLPIISKIIDNSDMAFFSKNLASLHMAAMMETEITKETITSIAARLKSEQETTS
jgi:hypothetical protein